MNYKYLGIAIIFILISASVSAQEDQEGSNEKASLFRDAFGFHDPMYFSLTHVEHPDKDGSVTAAKFQVSFLYELFGFYGGNERMGGLRRGFNVAYTQTSFWDLSSASEPFYDTSLKPAIFLLWQKLGGDNMSWVNRLDVEGGYQHHSNGKDGADSRFIDVLYLKPTFVWEAFDDSYFFVAPKVWHYFNISWNNADIQDYWGNLDLELTWRAAFGLQVENHLIPAKETFTYNLQLTYPLAILWRPLNFYLFVDYWTGAGETILRYDHQSDGWNIGFALSR